MCSHYESIKDHQIIKAHFKVDADALEGAKADLWPGYMGAFIRKQPTSDRHEAATSNGADEPSHELLLGSFGLIPHWAADTKIARSTYNARSETVAEKPSFRDAWRAQRRCIIPAEAIYEPDWRSGKAIPARISRADKKPLGIAGLWSTWKSPKGELIHSYTMLTINADTHPLLRQFHKPTDEKRMVVILHDDQHTGWLDANTNECRAFLNPYPAELLTTG